MMKPRLIYIFAAIITLFTGVFVAQPRKAVALSTKPNILFILLDDMRKDELRPLTVLGSGTWLKFTNASVEVPMCCPSRASILTGRYSSEVGVRNNSSGQYLDDSRTIATVLKAGGYRTGLAGKYLNNFPWTRGGGYIPPGWDYWRADGSTAKANESKGYYSADYLTVAAKNFINQTPAGQPFFFYLAYNQPHLPAKPPARYAQAPVSLEPWPPNFNEADVSDKAKPIRALPLADQTTINTWLSQRTSKERSLMAVNDGVQSILSLLQTKGLLDNTIVFFTSDNGYGFGSHRVVAKAFPYEELTSMPFYVQMPGQTAQPISQQISFVDLAPTFADIAGTTMPLTRGISFKSLLTNPAATLPRTWVFFEGPERTNAWRGVKSEQYKYIVYNDGFKEFYDLAKDPYEMTSKAYDPAYSSLVSQADAALKSLQP